jgi:TRAP transporter 4TM/12TM fusion protein
MNSSVAPSRRAQAAVEVLYVLVATFFFLYLLRYFMTGVGGPSLLAVTLVPVAFALHALDSLRKGDLYPRLGFAANAAVAGAYVAASGAVALYMNVEFIDIGTVRAGFWSATDLAIGGLMVVFLMEYARRRHVALFVLNAVLILYAVYGWLVPGMFFHPGLSWTRVVTAMSVEEATGVFSRLPQLALTLIASFVLVLSALRAFGCVDSILKIASLIAVRTPNALPQAAVVGSLGVGAVSGSGAANAITVGSATIPAMIGAGLPPPNAAAVETASSVGGQLMPPVMGISAFLMAEFMGRSYFDVVARGYAPALIYYASVAVGVYLMSVRFRIARIPIRERLDGSDWTNLGGFVAVVGGLILLMATFYMHPMFAALYVFAAVGGALVVLFVARASLAQGASGLRTLGQPLLRFIDSFAEMTVELTLLLSTLSIMTGAFVITGVPTKIGFILVEAAGVNLAAMVLVAFFYGALLGTGLPPAPTYILTALVIAPPMIKAGVDPWSVHFFAFFLAVWGELTPPTSVAAAVTAKIANAPFGATLWRAIPLCVSLFVLMAAVFSRPELVREPGFAQLGAAGLVLAATVGFSFAIQARFSARPGLDLAARVALAAAALVVLFHPDARVAVLACLPIALLAGYWLFRRRAVAAPA